MPQLEEGRVDGVIGVIGEWYLPSTVTKRQPSGQEYR
jgi:hypothetical protein